jgi:hypothetical protein
VLQNSFCITEHNFLSSVDQVKVKRWKNRLHPAIDFHAKALGHHKVSACDVAGLPDPPLPLS